jgi:hypothetical protein
MYAGVEGGCRPDCLLFGAKGELAMALVSGSDGELIKTGG